MRSFAFLVGTNCKMAEPRAPVSHSTNVNVPRRCRLEDDVATVFAKACATGDREAAADLLALLEKWHARRAIGPTRERRVRNETLQRARRDLRR